VAGAQLLAASGIPIQLIQLLGRWTSMAIQRYTQEAALAVVPDLPSQVLEGDGIMHLLPGPCSATPAQQPLAVVQPPISKDDTHNDGAIARLDQSTKDHDDQILKIRGELNQMREAITKPQFAFVKRIRSPVVHIGSNVELANPPRRWRSKCGWSYMGSAIFSEWQKLSRP